MQIIRLGVFSVRSGATPMGEPLLTVSVIFPTFDSWRWQCAFRKHFSFGRFFERPVVVGGGCCCWVLVGYTVVVVVVVVGYMS